MACVSAADPDRQQYMRSWMCVSLSVTRLAWMKVSGEKGGRGAATNDVASGRCATVCANDDAPVELDGHDGCLQVDVDKQRLVGERIRTPRLTSPVLSLSMSM